MESDFASTSRQGSRPSTAHASIRMVADSDDDAGFDRMSQSDSGHRDQGDSASLIQCPASRPPSSREMRIQFGVYPRGETLFQICRIGDVAALANFVTNLSAEQLKEKMSSGDPMRVGMQPLHYAARYNHYEVTVKLVDLGADVTATDDYENTVLHHAAKFSFQESRPKLEEAWIKNRNSDSGISNDSTPSTSSADSESVKVKGGHHHVGQGVHGEGEPEGPSIVKFLVEKGADVNKQNRNEATPLHVGCMRGSVSRVREFLEIPSVNILARDKQNAQALHNACTFGHIEVVRLLLAHKADLRAKDSKMQTPVHRSVMAGYPEIVEALMDEAEKRHGPEYKAEMLHDADANGRVALQLAAIQGNSDVCSKLLGHGADPNTQKEGSGATVLHIAAKAGNVAMCSALLKGGAYISAVNTLQQTPLHLAAHYDKKSCVEFLLSRGAQIDARDVNHFTPLLLASAMASPETIQTLLDSGASIDVVDNEEKTALHWAAYKGNLKIAKLILAHRSGPSLVNKRDIEGDTPMHAAAEMGHVEVMKLLKENGADVAAKNDAEDTVLLGPAYKGHTKAVDLLLNWDPSLVHQVEEHSYSALEFACKANHVEVANRLIQAGADVNAQNEDGMTALDSAILFGSLKCAQLLLDKGANANFADKNGETSVHNAMYCDYRDMVEELVKKGADLKATTKSGLNGLDFAVLQEARKSTEAIIASDKWREALDNWYLDEVTGFRKTPLRSLIEHMPDMALQVFDKSMERSTEYDFENSGDKKCVIIVDYTFLDDTEWAERSLHQSKRCCCCCWYRCCNNCSTGSSDGGASMEQAKQVEGGLEGLKGGALETSDDTNKSTGKSSEEGEDPYKLKCRGITEKFDLKKNHPLILMVQHKRMELLLHPLSQALLNYKWKKFGRFVFYSNLALYFIFLVSLTGYALTVDPPVPTFVDDKKEEFFFGGVCKEENSSLLKIGWRKDHVITYIARPVILVLAGLNVLRELFQMINRRLLSYIDLENALDLTCYATAVVFVLDFSDCSLRTGAREPWQWQLGAISVFLSWINLLMTIRKVPFFGIYVVMVTDVFRTFCKFFLVFMFFIIGFAMAFYILLQQQAPFRSPFEAFVKTFVMMIGELDFQGIFFESPARLLYYPTLSYGLFVLFILVMSIILMNLLVGLAVSDIKEVKDNATLARLAMQARMVIEVETMLPNCIRKRCISNGETLPDPNPEASKAKDLTDKRSTNNNNNSDNSGSSAGSSSETAVTEENNQASDNEAKSEGDRGSQDKNKAKTNSMTSKEYGQLIRESVAEAIQETSLAINSARAEAREKVQELEKQLLESLIQTNAFNDVMKNMTNKLDAMGAKLEKISSKVGVK